jgi:hypothetical protein
VLTVDARVGILLNMNESTYIPRLFEVRH